MRTARAWLVVLLTAAVGGCDPSSTEPVIDAPSFYVGQRWIYTHDAVLTDSTGAVVNALHDSVEVKVGSVAETLDGMTGLVRMDLVSLLPWFGPGPAPGIQSLWYGATGEGLTEYAYRNPGATVLVMLGAGGERRIFRAGSLFDPLRAVRQEAAGDSIQRREEPRRVLTYPLKKGTAWDAFRVPFLQHREVAEIETIGIMGRNMQAARIRTTLPVEYGPLEWDDWVSPRGLLRRVIRMSFEVYDANMARVGRNTQTETATLVIME